MQTKSRERTPAPSRRKGWTEQQSPGLYRLARIIVEPFIRFWIRYYVSCGQENIPDQGGMFLIANHASAVDPILLGYPIQNRLLRGPGKVELFQNRFFGFIIRRVGMFPIKQGQVDAAAVRTMIELYRNGRLVLVFPEGGRSEDGRLREFFPDFARLLLRLRAPMIAAGIAGARDIMPMGTIFPRPWQPAAVCFGEPFDLSEFYDRELTDEVTREAAAYMHDRVAELIARAQEKQAALRLLR